MGAKKYTFVSCMIACYEFGIVGTIDFVHAHQYHYMRYFFDTLGIIFCFLLIDILWKLGTNFSRKNK